MPKLGVNIEPVALLREKGRIQDADPVTAALMAELGGADLIVCTLREGFRPVTEKDVKLLKAMVKCPIEIQVFPTEPLIGLALAVAADFITVIPARPDDGSGDVRLDAQAALEDLGRVFREIRSPDRRVGLLVEPDIVQVKAAATLAADYVEFSLGRLSEFRSAAERGEYLENFGSSLLAAGKMGLGAALSGGLDYRNAADLISKGKIHHAVVGGPITARALWTGYEQAVRDMTGLLH
jgi:pyridoxine 5-phosphate synthase